MKNKTEFEVRRIKKLVDKANDIAWGDETKPITDKDLQKALDYFNEAIEAGCDDAMVSLGAMYYVGRGVEQDYTKAIEYYTKAANYGNIYAISNLGYCYYYGRNIPIDMEKAYQMFSKAALLHEPIAIYKCGDMYMWGKYVDKDENTAFRLYKQAYNIASFNGFHECYPDVCMRLGGCYHHGRGAEVDLEQSKQMLEEAIKYFQQKLDMGDTFASSGLRSSSEELIEVMKELEKQNEST